MTINLDRMISGYTECAEWADCGPDHETNGHDWAGEVLERMETDCKAFIAACGEPLLDALAELAPNYSDERFGHDFWLTRNGHGAGFWDRAELEPSVGTIAVGNEKQIGSLGAILTALARKVGACDLYLGDDRLVYAA